MILTMILRQVVIPQYIVSKYCANEREGGVGERESERERERVVY